MTSERVGDMTKQELEAWITQIIERRMRYWPGERPDDERSPAEVFESMRKNIIKRKPGQPSTLQMLREDRDR